jgi:hypothetical protein
MQGRIVRFDASEGSQRFPSNPNCEIGTDNQDCKPGFHYWVHTILRKRNCIVANVKRRWQTTHKYGNQLPETVAEALVINDQNGSDFRHKALGKEVNKGKKPGRLQTA